MPQRRPTSFARSPWWNCALPTYDCGRSGRVALALLVGSGRLVITLVSLRGCHFGSASGAVLCDESGRRRSLADHTADLADRHRIPRERDQAPGGAGRRVGRRVAAEVELDGNVEGLRRAVACLPAEPPELGGDLGELVRVLDAHGEEALVPDRAAERPGLAV